MMQDDISKLIIQNNFFDIRYSKYAYYIHDGNLYRKCSKKSAHKHIYDKLKEQNINTNNTETITKILDDIKDKITIHDIIKNTCKNKSYIGYNNVTYDIENDKIINDSKIIVTNVINYNYNINDNNENIYDDVDTIDLYDYMMMSIYETFRYNKNKYFYKIEMDKLENINLMKRIFEKYIRFYEEGEKIRTDERAIIYGSNINNLEYMKYIMIPIEKLKIIDDTKEQQIFNQIFGKYKKMYEENKFEIPKGVGVINNPIMEILETKKVGRKKIYLTEEDRKTARQKYLHDWKQKDESKIKIREYQRKYHKNLKIKSIIKTTGKQDDNNIIELKK